MVWYGSGAAKLGYGLFAEVQELLCEPDPQMITVGDHKELELMLLLVQTPYGLVLPAKCKSDYNFSKIKSIPAARRWSRCD